jgi:hypothetical protein
MHLTEMALISASLRKRNSTALSADWMGCEMFMTPVTLSPEVSQPCNL